MARIALLDLCATRSGDKGDICNVAIFAYSDAAYAAIRAEATAERVKEADNAADSAQTYGPKATGGESHRAGGVRHEVRRIGASIFATHSSP